MDAPIPPSPQPNATRRRIRTVHAPQQANQVQLPERGDSATPHAQYTEHAAGPLFAFVVTLFNELGLKYVKLDGQTVLHMAYGGDNGSWDCFAQVQESAARFVFYSVLIPRVPESKRLAVAEYITRANYDLVLGNFELDFADGEIRFKTSADLSETTPTKTFFKTLIFANLLATDRYFSGLMSVLYADAPPMQAISLIENAPTRTR